MKRALRLGCGILFGLLALGMLVVAVVFGSAGVGALADGTPAERGAAGLLFLLAASVTLLWMQIALRLTGARTSPPGWRGRALMWLVAIEGLGMLIASLLPAYRSARASAFFALMLASAVLYGVIRARAARKADS